MAISYGDLGGYKAAVESVEQAIIQKSLSVLYISSGLCMPCRLGMQMRRRQPYFQVLTGRIM